MESTLAMAASSSSYKQPLFHFSKPISPSSFHLSKTLKKPFNSTPNSSIRVCISSSLTPIDTHKNPIIHKLQHAAKTVILTAATLGMIGKFSHLQALAESPAPAVTGETLIQEEKISPESPPVPVSSPLSEFLGSNSEALDALKSLLKEKLENGEDEEALKILDRLISAQPESTEFKFLAARLMNEMGQTENARNMFEEILKRNPLSFEALFENALLMDRCGEGQAVITRLGEALRIAEEENKTKESRDIKLIMAQVLFLQKNVDEALKSYEELEKEDPSDFRPYFCKGMIYSLMDQNAEAKVQFAKYRELSPRKFEVEGFLQTPLSRMKLFGTNDETPLS